MGTNEITILVIVAVAAIALITFLIMRNKKDRKEILPPTSEDPMEDDKKGQRSREDQL